MSANPKARFFAASAVLLGAIVVMFLWRFWAPASMERESEEYTVYSTVIEADLAAGMRSPKPAPTIVVQSTPATLYQKPILFFFLRGLRSFRSDTGAAYSLMIASVLTGDDPQKRLTSKFTLSHPYTLATPARSDGFVSSVSNVGNRAAMYAFSRVVFDREFSQALLYIERHCGPLCGEYEYLLLKKTDDKWIIARRYLTGVS